MSDATRPDRSWGGPALAATVVLVAGTLATARLPLDQLVTVVPDDAYFYLKTAWHLAQGHGSTFDGLNATNGYHPLYLWLLTAVSRVTPLQGGPGLVTVLWLDAALTAVWIGVMAALSRRLGWSRLATWALVMALLPIAALGDVGMEVNLLLPLAWAAVLVGADPRGGARVELLTGVFGALACLARLDAVLFVGAAAAGTLLARGGVWPLRASLVASGLRLLGPSIAALGGVALANLVLYGHTATVSSWLKAGRQPELSAIGGRFAANPQTIVLLVSVAISMAAVARAWRTRAASDVRVGALALWAAVYVAVMSVALRGGLELWYFPMPLAVGTMAGLHLADAWLRALPRVRTVLLTGVAIGSVAAAGLVVRVQTGRGWFYTDGLAVARWIDATLPADAHVYQVDNAGIVAYFANRAVINGDGLINSWDYQADVRAGRLPQYLQRLGVEYVVFDDYAADRAIDVQVPLWNAPAVTLYWEPPPAVAAHVGRFVLLRADPRTARVTASGESRPGGVD